MALGDITIRALKGGYMFLLFVLFGVAILLAVTLIVPFLWLSDRFTGPRPTRMQAVIRAFFRAFLWLLGVGGLLREAPPIGRPATGPCMVVANHPGLFDILFLAREIPRASMMVKRSLAYKVGLAPLLKLSRYVRAPSAGNRIEGLKSAQETLACLRDGYSFVLFPEGTRSPHGGLHPFQAGAFRLARRAGVPVQPVVIHNAPPFLAHEDRWYFPPRHASPFQMEYLEPIPTDRDSAAHSLMQHVESLIKGKLAPAPATPPSSEPRSRA